MIETLGFEQSIWQSLARGTAVYFTLAVILRLIPKRHAGDLAPTDLLALIVVGALAADAIRGDASAMPDILLMIIVVLLWDYLANLAEYYFPRFRHVAQDSPTLLIHKGDLLHDNLRKEKLTEQELMAALRKQGIEDIKEVRQAILEVDGHISVIVAD